MFTILNLILSVIILIKLFRVHRDIWAIDKLTSKDVKRMISEYQASEFLKRKFDKLGDK